MGKNLSLNEVKKNGEKLDTLRSYLRTARDMAMSDGFLPSVHELAQELGVGRSSLRNYFNSNENLHQDILSEFPEVSKKCFTPDDFSDRKLREKLKKVDGAKRFFITAAETEKPLWNNGEHVEALKHWAKKRNAEVLILPLGKELLKLDGRLKDFNVITGDLKLNNNIKIVSILTSITAVSPGAGLARVSGQSESSLIVGATKLTKESVATDVGKLPHLIYTTGCITNAEYRKDKSRLLTKAGYVAGQDHEISGIIVEIKNNETFFPKEVVFDIDGSFVEVTKKGAHRYHADGSVTREKALNFNIADGHVEEADPLAEFTFLDIARRVGVKTVSLHDVFSYQGPGHHTTSKITQAKMFEHGWNIKSDIKLLNVYLKKWEKVAEDKVYVVDSNHDIHIEKAVKSFQLDQAATYRVFLEMSLALMDGKNPLIVALQKYSNFKSYKVQFLKPKERCVLKNKFGEMALHFHGDIGADGARGGTGSGKSSLAVSVGCSIVGHTHSPRIIPGSSHNGFGNGGVWVNGTSTYVDHRMPDYTKGPSSWLQTSTLTFGSKDGRFLRTQITIIDGDWCLD